MWEPTEHEEEIEQKQEQEQGSADVPCVKLIKDGVPISMPEKPFYLTPASAMILQKGAAGQGFIYYADLETAEIHLLAANNPKNDLLTPVSNAAAQQQDPSLEDQKKKISTLLSFKQDKLENLKNKQDANSLGDMEKTQIQLLQAEIAKLEQQLEHIKQQIQGTISARRNQKAATNTEVPENLTPVDRFGNPYKRGEFSTTVRAVTPQTGGLGGGDLHKNGELILRAQKAINENSLLLAGGFWIDYEGEKLKYKQFRTRSTRNQDLVRINPLHRFHFDIRVTQGAGGHSQVYVREIPILYLVPIVKGLPSSDTILNLHAVRSPLPDSTLMHLQYQVAWDPKTILSDVKAVLESDDKTTVLSKEQVGVFLQAYFDKEFPENLSLLESLSSTLGLRDSFEDNLNTHDKFSNDMKSVLVEYCTDLNKLKQLIPGALPGATLLHFAAANNLDAAVHYFLDPDKLVHCSPEGLASPFIHLIKNQKYEEAHQLLAIQPKIMDGIASELVKFDFWQMSFKDEPALQAEAQRLQYEHEVLIGAILGLEPLNSEGSNVEALTLSDDFNPNYTDQNGNSLFFYALDTMRSSKQPSVEALIETIVTSKHVNPETFQQVLLTIIDTKEKASPTDVLIVEYMFDFYKYSFNVLTQGQDPSVARAQAKDAIIIEENKLDALLGFLVSNEMHEFALTLLEQIPAEMAIAQKQKALKNIVLQAIPFKNIAELYYKYFSSPELLQKLLPGALADTSLLDFMVKDHYDLALKYFLVPDKLVHCVATDLVRTLVLMVENDKLNEAQNLLEIRPDIMANIDLQSTALLKLSLDKFPEIKQQVHEINIERHKKMIEALKRDEPGDPVGPEIDPNFRDESGKSLFFHAVSNNRYGAMEAMSTREGLGPQALQEALLAIVDKKKKVKRPDLLLLERIVNSAQLKIVDAPGQAPSTEAKELAETKTEQKNKNVLVITKTNLKNLLVFINLHSNFFRKKELDNKIVSQITAEHGIFQDKAILSLIYGIEQSKFSHNISGADDRKFFNELIAKLNKQFAGSAIDEDMYLEGIQAFGLLNEMLGKNGLVLKKGDDQQILGFDKPDPSDFMQRYVAQAKIYQASGTSLAIYGELMMLFAMRMHLVQEPAQGPAHQSVPKGNVSALLSVGTFANPRPEEAHHIPEPKEDISPVDAPSNSDSPPGIH